MCFVHRCTDVFWMFYCKIIKVFKKKSRSQIWSGGRFKLPKAANLSYNTNVGDGWYSFSIKPNISKIYKDTSLRELVIRQTRE